jgi:hypothetical protein
MTEKQIGEMNQEIHDKGLNWKKNDKDGENVRVLETILEKMVPKAKPGD